VVLSVSAVAATATVASAQIAVSANDGKITLVNGATVPAPSPVPDTVAVIDLRTSPPKLIVEFPAPYAVIGPPQGVAITPDQSLALVANSTNIDPNDATRTVPDDRVTIVDLKASPPAPIATVHAGKGASGLSVSPDGSLALVANRMEGTVSVLRISGKTVEKVGTVSLDAPDSGPSHVAFAPDGRTALVTRNNDSLITVLNVDGTTVTKAGRDFASGFKPYGIEVTPDGRLAFAANVGAGATGGSDTVSVIDMQALPLHGGEQVSVGPIPEGLAVSPDGRFVALTVMNGTNLPASSPLHNANGRLRIYRVVDKTIAPLTEAPLGAWCQGVAWGPGGASLLVQCMLDKEIRLFDFDGKALKANGAIKLKAAPAGLRTAGTAGMPRQ
jgi:DNA-binding beta-propeller fold protein YncE